MALSPLERIVQQEPTAAVITRWQGRWASMLRGSAWRAELQGARVGGGSVRGQVLVRPGRRRNHSAQTRHRGARASVPSDGAAEVLPKAGRKKGVTLATVEQVLAGGLRGGKRGLHSERSRR